MTLKILHNWSSNRMKEQRIIRKKVQCQLFFTGIWQRSTNYPPWGSGCYLLNFGWAGQAVHPMVQTYTPSPDSSTLPGLPALSAARLLYMKWQVSHSLAGHTLAGSALSKSQGQGCHQWSDNLEAWNLMGAHWSGGLGLQLLISFTSNQHWGTRCKVYALEQCPLRFMEGLLVSQAV